MSMFKKYKFESKIFPLTLNTVFVMLSIKSSAIKRLSQYSKLHLFSQTCNYMGYNLWQAQYENEQRANPTKLTKSLGLNSKNR